jgi:gamma-glutamyltranspeptidase
MQPAIKFAEEGFVVGEWFATMIKRAAPQLARDPVSARL